MSEKNPQGSVTATIVQVANPLGSVIAYSGAQDPPTENIDGAAKWLLCDGRALDPKVYGELFALIGKSFGDGTVNNPNHIQNAFNIPDLRGRFIRGTDDMGGTAAGNDPDMTARSAMMTGGNTGQSSNKIGSLQPDQMLSHNHTYTGVDLRTQVADASLGYGFNSSVGGAQQVFTMSNTGGNETRPRNAYLNFIIRVK